jgi:hypothetical protein
MALRGVQSQWWLGRALVCYSKNNQCLRCKRAASSGWWRGMFACTTSDNRQNNVAVLRVSPAQEL